MTFSIVGRSDDGEAWGVAVASKALAVGSVVPAAAASAGAIAAQSEPDLRHRPLALQAMRSSFSARQTLEMLLAGDGRSAIRQLGIVDAEGGSATFTGEDCLDWSGSSSGHGFAIQGNCLAGPEVIDAMVLAWSRHENLELPERLIETLAAGDRAGGDRRGRQSAALYVARDGAGYGGGSDTEVDLRVDDDLNASETLFRLLKVHRFYYRAPDPAHRTPMDATLRSQLEQAAIKAGSPDFLSWAGLLNLELRVAPDMSWVDVRVITYLLDGADSLV